MVDPELELSSVGCLTGVRSLSFLGMSFGNRILLDRKLVGGEFADRRMEVGAGGGDITRLSISPSESLDEEAAYGKPPNSDSIFGERGVKSIFGRGVIDRLGLKSEPESELKGEGTGSGLSSKLKLLLYEFGLVFCISTALSPVDLFPFLSKKRDEPLGEDGEGLPRPSWGE
jgi:hypothetical protein